MLKRWDNQFLETDEKVLVNGIGSDKRDPVKIMKQPFIHKFSTLKHKYIYDVNTNNILSIDQVIYDIIDDYGNPSSVIINKWRGKYDAKLINKSLNRIHEFYKFHGIFSSEHPITMSFPMCEEHFYESLQSKLGNLILNVTERCNMRCKYCSYSGTYHYERRHSIRSMSWEIAKKAIDYFHTHSQANEQATISFFGGEPLLNFDFIKKSVEYSKTKYLNFSKINFHITTNGTIINEEVIKFLIKHDIIFQVSLDGSCEEHDKYRVFKNGDGSFNLIVRNLQKIQQMDRSYYERRVGFSPTLCSGHNLLEINKFFLTNELFKENFLTINYVSPYDTDFYKIYSEQMNNLRFNEDMKNLEEQYINLRITNGPINKFLSSFFERSLITLQKRVFKLLGKRCSPNGICVPGVQRLFVDVNGRFYPCERVGAAFCIGNVDKGIEYKKVRSVIKKYIKESTKDCINCWAVRLCDLCFSFVRKGDKFDYESKKEHCITERSGLHSCLVRYATIMERNPKAFDFVKEMTSE